MSITGTSFNRHLLAELECHDELNSRLASVLTQVAFAAKVLATEIGRAALVGKLGLIGDKNATGDAQKKLDVFTNDVVIEAFLDTKLVFALVSEELEEVKCLACEESAEYILCIDPLDGSSNVDINGDVATIFGIYRRLDGDLPVEQHFYRQGLEQVAAGYVLYGASTMLVYTAGHGVHGFTLDRAIGEFILSHENIRCPKQGKSYSANMARQAQWPEKVRDYIDLLNDPANATRPSLRYNGALAADFHRCLIEGGIYFYPQDDTYKDGKLRLLYECAPLAMIAEQAGARASDGQQRILDLQASQIHQRSPLVIGSHDDVTRFEQLTLSETI